MQTKCFSSIYILENARFQSIMDSLWTTQDKVVMDYYSLGHVLAFDTVTQICAH